MFFENSLPVGKYGRFSLFKKSFCPAVFSKTVKDRVMKFSGMIDLSIVVCDWTLSMSAVTSGRHRKWKKEIGKFKFTCLNQNLYHFTRPVFKCPKQWTPLEVETSTSGYFKKNFKILNFQSLKSFFIIGVFDLKLTYDVGTVNVYSYLKIFWKKSLPVMRDGMKKSEYCFYISS